MGAYLKRLGGALVAYQVADIVSKVVAVGLLPVYTRFIHPSGYGDLELIATGVILVSILARLGMIEAFTRYWFADETTAARDALVRRAAGFLLVTTTAVAVPAALLAAPLSRAVLGHRDVPLMLLAVLGLWSFTNLELAYGLLRVQERVRVYAVASLINVTVTIAASVILVTSAGLGAKGLLLGNYGTSTLVLVGLWWTERDRLRAARRANGERFRALLRFGLPTVPAEASVYALSVADRYVLLHLRSAAFVGLYSIAVKLAGGIAFLVRAFQYAWPPLAYSIADEREASRLYGLVATYYVVVTGTGIAALALLSHWVVRLLAAPAYHAAAAAVPWVALGWALYGLFVILLAVAGRAKVTSRNLPAALAGLAVNIGLLFALVPPLGLAGAGIALCGAYLVMLAVMHLLTRRLFPAAFEWGRIAHAVLVIGGVTGAGVALLPDRGAAGLVSRIAALALVPGLLWVTRFASPAERAGLRGLPALLRRGAAA